MIGQVLFLCSWESGIRYAVRLIICLSFFNNIVNAINCSHNYGTNRFEYRNVVSNKLDLTEFNNLEYEKIIFNGREFGFKRKKNRYPLRCTLAGDTYYPSEIICVYLSEQQNPFLVLKEEFSFWIDQSEKTLKIITMDSYIPQNTLPFHEVVNFVNHLRGCLSKQWHFLHIGNEPVYLESTSIQLQTRIQNILSEGNSKAERLGAKPIKWAENIYREILPPRLYEEAKRWIQVYPNLGQIQQGLKALENTPITEEFKEFIEMCEVNGFIESSSLKEIYLKLRERSSEGHFLALFCNYPHTLINELIWQSCRRGLRDENAFDRLLAIHILEEFSRIAKLLEKKYSWIRFSQEGRLSSKAKPVRFPFYLEELKHEKEDAFGFKFHRCPSNPALFLIKSFAGSYHRLRLELCKLTREEIGQIYEDQKNLVEAGINYQLPLEKRIKQQMGNKEIGRLVDNYMLHLFLQRDGEELVLMTDQALNCLKNSQGELPDHINKDEIWKTYFEDKKSWQNDFFSNSNPDYMPLVSWYLIGGFINEYDNFFVQLPLGWFEQAKEAFVNTYYTREEDWFGNDVRKKW